MEAAEKEAQETRQGSEDWLNEQKERVGEGVGFTEKNTTTWRRKERGANGGS